jgi:hypothetical protein
MRKCSSCPILVANIPINYNITTCVLSAIGASFPVIHIWRESDARAIRVVVYRIPTFQKLVADDREVVREAATECEDATDALVRATRGVPEVEVARVKRERMPAEHEGDTWARGARVGVEALAILRGRPAAERAVQRVRKCLRQVDERRACVDRGEDIRTDWDIIREDRVEVDRPIGLYWPLSAVKKIEEMRDARAT